MQLRDFIMYNTQGKPRIQDIRISKKSCITVNLLSTVPFLSHPGTRQQTGSLHGTNKSHGDHEKETGFELFIP